MSAPPKLTQIGRRATIAAGVLASSLTLNTITYAQGPPVKPTNKTMSSQNDDRNQVQEPLIKISGTVTDVAGAIVEKAYVDLHDPKSGSRLHMSTNENGIFEFTGVPAGIYDLEITATGFMKFEIKNVDFKEERKFEKAFVLKAAEFTMGVVITSDPLIVLNEPDSLPNSRFSRGHF